MSLISDRINANWNIVGHNWAVNMLREHVRRGTTRHAYLITGPRGVGRRTLALRFAQALNCSSPAPSGDPCGACYHCTHLEIDLRGLMSPRNAGSGNGHPDLRLIEPVTRQEMKALLKDRYPEADDESRRDTEGASQGSGPRLIRVGQIRLEREIIHLRPFAAAYRVLVFVRFEEAMPQAANALLKTLEEAPPHAVLMLTASDAESMLPTIVSRCEVLRLQPVPVPEVQTLLEERGADIGTARLLAHVSGGCPGAALRMLEDESLVSERTQRLEDLLSLLPATKARRFAYAARLASDRSAMRDILALWLSFWRDVLWRAGGATTALTNIDRQDEIEAIAQRLTLPQALRMVEDLDSGLRKLDANVNARLLAEVLMLDWPR